jgi:uncharacterized membrane protein
MSHATRTGALLLAVLSTGSMTGVFLLYSHTVMPGLGRTDDRTFVAAFTAIDRAITNPLFLGTFLGGLLFTGVAALFSLGGGARPVLPWLLAGFVLYLIAVIVTFAIHLPLNDALKAAAPGADPAVLREQFHEAVWIRWNLVRAVTSTAAFACLAWALLVCGRIR